MRRIEDYITRVNARGQWQLTDFLSPREQTLATSRAEAAGMVVQGYGGYQDAERQRLLLMPGEWYPEAADFHITTLSIDADEPITHGALLGALLGSGIERRKVGDLAVDGERALCAVDRMIAEHVSRELHHAGRVAVHVEVVDSEVVWPKVVYNTATLSVASMRLDAVVAAACHWSRGTAQEVIQAGRVSVEHVATDRADEPVEVGDVLSVRGFGRVRVFESVGLSKKGRIRLVVGILPSRR
ncbi:YlmH family RNA-binding protein [Alicyclobacillus sp. ALC3]|uniref:YlmH family RNA-binding protein n=1 Tax=Alicyclobacillus sp. ALC3 TaxID=2796143 RepID=UPI00237922C1|nr:YlmH/Sll1252 family protein [Alicyclobacillus sp. ALC3]WDL97432.1 hypothetical protein JC200_01470 [Alicyclobacillus sp. ALC3]